MSLYIKNYIMLEHPFIGLFFNCFYVSLNYNQKFNEMVWTFITFWEQFSKGFLFNRSLISMSDIISDLLTKKTPHSFLKLGKYYLIGIHVSKDLKKAESYLKKAKKSNEPKADYYLNMLKGEKTGKYPEYIENTTNY